MDRNDLSELGHMLLYEGAKPKALQLSLLKHITNDFSDDKKIGHGGFAVVYKGMLENGTVAVKKLLRTLDIDEKLFSKEVNCLMNTKHKNIVRFLGYCSDTQGEMVDYEGKLVLADVRERLLCFEYLSQGSLDKQITDASCGLEWKKRYQIINGICEGLYYLHQNNILHLDLKPANILLDYNMVPKIADFGISRFSDEKQTGVTTSSTIGTVGYVAPEFYGRKRITYKLDIYSLGIIMIDILTGEKGYPDIDHVLEMWRNRLEKTEGDTQLVQVKVCTEIAIQCTDFDPMKRPDIQDIIDKLGATVSADDSVVEDVRSLVEVVGAEVVGREMEKREIIACLSRSTTQKITILPIYGIGGIGKTTIAKFVFNDSKFKEYSRVWIYVSQTFDLKKIGNSILEQLSDRGSNHTDLQMMENSLQNLLSGKRVLIILDDLWERESSQLKNLESMLKLGEGSKVVVVVTTREESIAQKFHTNRVNPYKLAPLTDDICWTIIKNKSSFETRSKRAQLELIGKDIAKKCGGVALAAQSIGYMLNDMEFDEWVSVNNSEIWDVLGEEHSPDHLRASLLLSYGHMSSYLKLCFAYFATFPKGHKIPIEDLAYQWIALGLVEPSRIFTNIQTSHNYIWMLLGMSFLEHPRSKWTMAADNTFLVMHDLVHDLARLVLADEINIESPACRYAWLADQRKLFKSSENPLAKIRALHLIDRGYLQLHAEAFSPAKFLRVLDLSRCCARELPDSIGQLKQLRYLDASWNLRFAGYSENQARPESILIPVSLGSVDKLQYLNLAHRRRPIGLPEVISKLTELRYLNISYCEGYYLLDSPSGNQTFIESIGILPNLEQLDMSGNNYVFCVPESFSSLKKLNLYGCQQIASVPDNVGKVDIRRLFGLLDLIEKGFPVRAIDSESSSSLVWLKHTDPDVLRIIDLENVKSVEEARSIRLMEKQRIEELSLEWSRGVRSVEQMELLTELVPPRSVKNLRIIGYEDAILPHWFMHISIYLPYLVSLEMWGCPCSILRTLVQLPKVVLRCTEEFNTDVGVDAANQLTFTKLEYLEIDCRQKSSTIPSSARAQYLYISGGDNVLSSLGECGSSTAASSSSSPVSKLKIENSELPLRKWILLHHLPGLSDLTISRCDDLTISPQITRSFTSLESLSLGCLRLEKLPEWLGELASLRQLNLDMQYLQELHENMRRLRQLQSLSLDACNRLTSLPQWLGELTLLKTLKISSCVGITSLPESMLTNLQELHISQCPELYEWSKLEENRMKLAHIKEKFISSTFDWRH